jgi:hypothetical protein
MTPKEALIRDNIKDCITLLDEVLINSGVSFNKIITLLKEIDSYDNNILEDIVRIGVNIQELKLKIKGENK